MRKGRRMKINVPPELINGVKSEIKNVDFLSDFSQSEKVKIITVLAMKNKADLAKISKSLSVLWFVVLLNSLAILSITIFRFK